MTEKFDIDSKLDEIANTKPSILKCSYSMAKKITEGSGTLTDMGILQFLRSLTIQPSDRIPDHIVFLCDKQGKELKMINLTKRKKIG